MPGIFGAIAARADRDPQPIAEAILGLLRHHDWYRTLLQCRGPVAVGATSTSPWFSPQRRWSETPQALLLAEGTAWTIDGNHIPDDAPDLAERLLELYLAAGDGFIERVGGHFNLVVVDRPSGRVQLLNDKLGFAHLYWYADAEIFLFGPELKAFLAWRGLSRRVDRAAAATMLAHECPLGTATLLEGVTMLGPAARVVWDGRQVTVTRRWRAETRPDHDRRREDFLDEAEALYARTVAKRLPAGSGGRTLVPLTGGLDSRLLLHQVRERTDLELFTHGQSDNSDYLIARQVAGALGLEARHRLIEIDPSWAGALARQAVWLNDGQLNLRNATVLGVSNVLGPGCVPYLNGIIGSHLSIGGPRCSPEDLVPVADRAAEPRHVLGFSGIAAGAARFATFMRPEIALELRDRAHERVLGAYAEWSHARLLGEQKQFYFDFNIGRRMQGTNDILKFQFHDLLPFVDEDLFDLFLRIPLAMKSGMALYHEFYRRKLTALARIPWQHTGHDLFAPKPVLRRTAEQRARIFRINTLLRRLSRGRINLRYRHAYNDRPAWLRRNRVFRDEMYGVLANVNATGCDWFDQVKVDAIRTSLDHGQDQHFHTLAQIYTMVVWHGQFLRDAPPGVALRSREKDAA